MRSFGAHINTGQSKIHKLRKSCQHIGRTYSLPYITASWPAELWLPHKVSPRLEARRERTLHGIICRHTPPMPTMLPLLLLVTCCCFVLGFVCTASAKEYTSDYKIIYLYVFLFFFASCCPLLASSISTFLTRLFFFFFFSFCFVLLCLHGFYKKLFCSGHPFMFSSAFFFFRPVFALYVIRSTKFTGVCQVGRPPFDL